MGRDDLGRWGSGGDARGPVAPDAKKQNTQLIDEREAAQVDLRSSGPITLGKPG